MRGPIARGGLDGAQLQHVIISCRAIRRLSGPKRQGRTVVGGPFVQIWCFMSCFIGTSDRHGRVTVGNSVRVLVAVGRLDMAMLYCISPLVPTTV